MSNLTKEANKNVILVPYKGKVHSKTCHGGLNGGVNA
jgi:hypothetical protein